MAKKKDSRAAIDSAVMECAGILAGLTPEAQNAAIEGIVWARFIASKNEPPLDADLRKRLIERIGKQPD